MNPGREMTPTELEKHRQLVTAAQQEGAVAWAIYGRKITPARLAEALCAAMPAPGGGSQLVYEDALAAATQALAAQGVQA